MGLALPCREQRLVHPCNSQIVYGPHVHSLSTGPHRRSLDSVSVHEHRLIKNEVSRPRGARAQLLRPASGKGRGVPVVCALSTPANADVGEECAKQWDGRVGQEALKPLPKHLVLDNPADDPSLGNPLQRHKRMGTDWMGVILDYERVMVEDTTNLHTEAWLRLAEEEVKPRPLTHSLKRAALMKAEQAIAEVLCWGREPTYVRRLAQRKIEIYEELLGDWRPAQMPGVRELLETLKTHQVPVAVCSTGRNVVDDLKQLGLETYISDVIAADDVERCQPDPEAYAYAAQRIGRPPVRCIVVGAGNQSFEAAHDCGMQCVAVAGQGPLYELSAADLVVKQLQDISFVNFKQLFTLEEGIEPQMEPEEEVETEAAPQGFWL